MPRGKKDKKEYGKSYIEKLLSHVSEDKRQAVLDALSDEKIYEVAGEDVLKQEDYSYQMNALQAKEQETQSYKSQLESWYATNKEALDAYMAAKDNPAGEAPKIDLSKYIDRNTFQAELDRRLNAFGQDALRFGTLIPHLAVKHFKEYGEVLDVDALVQHSRSTGLPIDKGGYEDYTKDKTQAKQAADIERRIKEAREAGRQEALKDANIPYPVGSDEPGTLDALFNGKTDGKYGVNAAIDFLREQQRNG